MLGCINYACIFKLGRGVIMEGPVPVPQFI